MVLVKINSLAQNTVLQKVLSVELALRALRCLMWHLKVAAVSKLSLEYLLSLVPNDYYNVFRLLL
jgi:hypothetical protein